MGYPFGVKGYKVLDLATHNVFLSRDVIFHEHSFPFASTSSSVANPFISCEDVVAPSSSVGNESFVTPISVLDLIPNDADTTLFPSPTSADSVSDNAITSSLISVNISPSPSQVFSPIVPSSPPVVPAPPVPSGSQLETLDFLPTYRIMLVLHLLLVLLMTLLSASPTLT